jgi:hypothetical protein
MKNRNGDFKPYYCLKSKKHIWVLGYFGGGSINFARFNEVAKDFSTTIGCSITTVNIDEMFKSRRFKGFKFVTSSEPNQKPIVGISETLEDVWSWLSD